MVYADSPRVDQCQILYTVVLPQYAHDALSMVDGVMEHVSAQNKDVPADEAFFLYKEYTSIREIHHQVIPEYVQPLISLIRMEKSC